MIDTRFQLSQLQLDLPLRFISASLRLSDNVFIALFVYVGTRIFLLYFFPTNMFFFLDPYYEYFLR